MGLSAPQQEYEAQIQAAFDRMVAKADEAERKKMLAEHARLTKEIEERRMDAERARMAAQPRARGDEIARFMRFFMRRGAPAALPSADASRPPPNRRRPIAPSCCFLRCRSSRSDGPFSTICRTISAARFAQRGR